MFTFSSLYALVIYTTIKWHARPSVKWAFTTGWIIGFATMSRPTESVMLFIPLMWGTANKEAAREKWALVKKHKVHVIAILLGGFTGILPQLLYWKSSTGSFIYDVGSKWVFLNPYFRVLFGWEKGWFIYTPVYYTVYCGHVLYPEVPIQKIGTLVLFAQYMDHHCVGRLALWWYLFNKGAGAELSGICISNGRHCRQILNTKWKTGFIYYALICWA